MNSKAMMLVGLICIWVILGLLLMGAKRLVPETYNIIWVLTVVVGGILTVIALMHMFGVPFPI